MKNNSLNIFGNILKSKWVLASLIVFFLIFTFFIFKNFTIVKGETTKTYYTVVWDENKKIIAKSESEKIDDILAANNIKIYPEDRVSSELIMDPVLDGGAGQKIVIKRAPVFYVEADGKVSEVRDWSQNVDIILEKTQIKINPKDIISQNHGAILTPGATISVTRVNEQDVTTYDEIDFNTITKSSTSVPFGQKVVTQEGKIGKLKKVYRVTYKNGLEVSRYLIGSSVESPKIDKIISTGVITGRANFGYYSGMVTSFYKGMTGHTLLVTNLSNGKQVTVKIIGSGPYNGPIMDMGTEPFAAIGGKISEGFIPSVSVQLLD